jgi:hypothetical protein
VLVRNRPLRRGSGGGDHLMSHCCLRSF